MSTPTLEAMIKDIHDRTAGIEEKFTEDKIRSMVTDLLGTLSPDDPVIRKITMGQGTKDEALIGTKYARFGLGIEDIEHAHQILRTAKARGLSEHGPSEQLESTFKAVTDAVYMPEDEVRTIDKRAIDDLFPRIPKSEFRGYDRILAIKGEYDKTQAYQRAMRAMDSAESGFGQQLIGATYARDMWDVARPESRLFGLIDSFEMTDPTVYIPVEVDIPEMIYVGENTANNSAAYATVKTGSNRVQVDAKKFVLHQMWSGELEEDALIQFVPFLRRQAQVGIAHYTDSLILNGDATTGATGNINSDDETPASTKHYLAFDGIRHAYLVDNVGNVDTAAGGVILEDLAMLKGMMNDSARLVDWGHPSDPNDLIYVTNPELADQIAMLDEILTIKQHLPNQGTLLNGEIARFIGHPIIASTAMPLTEVDGKVSFDTPANNIYAQLAVFNRRGIRIGWRRRIKVETERIPSTDQNRIVYSMRLGAGRFTPTALATGMEWAAGLIGIPLT